MYRKRLQELQKMEDDKQALTRVANYPVVKDTWTKVSEVYQRGKDGSRIIRFCGGVAETSANLAYKASMPVIEKLPVGPVNNYAVQKLEVLEEKYPTLILPTEEVVDNLKTYSSGKLDDMKNYGTNQFNRFAEVTRLNAMLDMADSVVDKLLVAPAVEAPEGDEAPEPSTDSSTTPTQEVVEAEPVQASTKVRMLSDKLKRRAYGSAMAKAGAIQKRSQEAVGKLMYTVDLIDYAQQNIRNMKFEDAEEKVKSIYEEITRESDEEETLPANANLEKKAIYVARTMTLRARSTFSTISRLSYALPHYARASVNEAYKLSESMYQTFMKAESFTDLSQQVLAELRDRLGFLEQISENLSGYVLESAPLKWLAAQPVTKAVIADLSNDSDADSSDSEGDENNATDNNGRDLDGSLDDSANLDDVE